MWKLLRLSPLFGADEATTQADGDNIPVVVSGVSPMEEANYYAMPICDGSARIQIDPNAP